MKRNMKHFFSAILYSLNTRQKLFVCYLLAVLMPCILTAVLFYSYLSDSMLKTDSFSIYTSTQQTAGRVDSAFQQADAIANVLLLNSGFNEVLESNGKENDAFAKRKNILKLSRLKPPLQEYDDVYRTGFYFNSNVIEANGESLFFVSDIDTEKIFREMIRHSGNAYWTSFEQSGRLGNAGAVISMLRPLYNPNDMTEVVGFIRVDYLKDRIARWIRDCLPSQNSLGFLINGSGNIFSFGCKGNLSANQAELPLPVEELLSRKDEESSYYTYSKTSAGNTLLCVHSVPSSDMFLVVVTPVHEIENTAPFLLIIIGMLIVMEIIIILCFGGALCSSIVRSKDIQLLLLYSQLNPHFLYNTLDVINWKAIKLNAPEIYQPIQVLSRFYKLTLNGGSTDISVRDELDHIRLYVQLQNLRFQDKIRLRTDYAAEVMDLRILNMLLQPIVENAAVHGILEKPEGSGTISVTARVDRDRLIFSIEDDGVGIPPEKLAHIWDENGESNGYGIWNVQERIRIAYGRAYGVSIQSHPGIGTRATLTLPVRKDK